jgi:hypothetical protein
MMPIKPDLNPSGAWGILDQFRMSSWSLSESGVVLSPSSMLWGFFYFQSTDLLRAIEIAAIQTKSACAD